MILVTGGAGFIGSNFVLDWIAPRRRAGRQPRPAHLRRQPRAPCARARRATRATCSCRATSATARCVDGCCAEHRPRAIVQLRGREPRRPLDPRARATSCRPTCVGTFTPARGACAATGARSPGAERARLPLPARRRPTRSTARSERRDPAVHRGRPRTSPTAPYSASKAASDHLVRAWHHTYGLPVLTTNCSNNYGPYHFLEKLIPLMIVNALAGKPLPVYGDGLQVRDWLYVERSLQRAPPRARAPARSARPDNIGGWNEQANIDVVQHHLRACSTSCSRDAAASRYARLITPTSPTARATTAATPSTRARSSASSAGGRPRPSRAASRKTVRVVSRQRPAGCRTCRAARTATWVDRTVRATGTPA